MVQALLEGTKTQARRIIRLRDGSLPDDSDISVNEDGTIDYVMDFSKTFPYWQSVNCPYGKVGDIVWVRESFSYWPLLPGKQGPYLYKADEYPEHEDIGAKWKPSIHMPFDACRLFLQITNIRVERLQDISEEDAIAEGVEQIPVSVVSDSGERQAETRFHDYGRYKSDHPLARLLHTAKGSYRRLWRKINGPNSWSENPFVWVVEFKRIENPIQSSFQP